MVEGAAEVVVKGMAFGGLTLAMTGALGRAVAGMSWREREVAGAARESPAEFLGNGHRSS